MPQFREKSVVIEAFQWDGTNQTEIVDWVVGSSDFTARWRPAVKATPEDQLGDDPKPEHISVNTRRGAVRVFKTDWLIRMANGDHTVIGDDMFRRYYEPA